MRHRGAEQAFFIGARMNNPDTIPHPPKDLHICFGGGNFIKIGRKMVNLCRERLDLKPNENVLDPGCGIGRLAIPLIEYLDDDAQYRGFDTFPVGIKWCRENLTPRFQNFQFKLIDVFNSTYNPYSPTSASEFVFPYEDDFFQFAMLNSVFTHMMPEDMMNYIEQLDRVLDDSGRVFVTFFLINDESRKLMDQGRSIHDFRKYGIFYTADPQDPMDAVGYEEEFVLSLFEKYNFKLKEIMYGDWCGRKAGNHQDIMLLTR